MTNLTAELAYVSSVANRSPNLTRDEEIDLARRFRDSGDQRAADMLVRAHLRLVIALAVKYRHYGVGVTELVAEGNCGLVVALSKFDPERGIRFSTYAKHWIRAHMLGHVLRSHTIVSAKSGLVRSRLFFKLRRERARVTALFGEGGAADDELAQRVNLSVERVRYLLGCLDVRGVSLEAPSGRDPNKRVVDTLPSGDDPEQRYFDDQRQDAAASAVATALGALDARERFIAERRIMAAPSEELSLSEIGRTFRISRERARQLEMRAKEKLGRSPAIQRNSHLLEWLAD